MRDSPPATAVLLKTVQKRHRIQNIKEDTASQAVLNTTIQTLQNGEGMNEEYNCQNRESVSYTTRSAYDPPEKKKKPVGSIVGMVLCVTAILLCGLLLLVMYLDSSQSTADTVQEPEDIYYATADGQYSYALLQYMAEPFASFEVYEQQQFYFVFDGDFYPAIVCMDDAAAEAYDTYIEYTYTDDESYPMPEEIELTGYSMAIDSEFAGLAIECYYEIFGYEYTEEEFYADFGYYYLNIGEDVTVSEEDGPVLPVLVILLAAVVLLVLFIIRYKKASSKKDNGSFFDVEMSRDAPGETLNINRGAGIAGALLGALLGGVVWTLIGMLGYVVGWIGVLMLVLAITGYKKLGKGLDKPGIAVSVIVTLCMIVAAEYVTWGLLYYQQVNEGIAHISVIDALAALPAAMTSMDLWGDMAGDIVMGFVLTGVAALYCLPAYLKGGSEAVSLTNRVAPRFGVATLLMIVAIFAFFFVGVTLMVTEYSVAGTAVMIIGVFGSLIAYIVSAQKKWKKGIFYDADQFRVGNNVKSELRSYSDIVSMNPDGEGNYVLRMYSGDTITIPAKYKGADAFVQLVRTKLSEQTI